MLRASRVVHEYVHRAERFAAAGEETGDLGRLRDIRLNGDWWSLLILRNAFAGERRFCEFERSLGVAKNILADRLRKLVAAGVLLQTTAEGGGHKEYLLTQSGRGLLPVVAALAQWASCGESEFRFIDRKSGRPVRLEFRANGRRVDPNDVQLAPQPQPT